MKRILFILSIILLVSQSAIAQFNVSNANGYVLLTDAKYNIDAIALLNGITSYTSITYTGTENNIEWRYTIDNSQYTSTQNSINPEASMLYHLYVNGQLTYSIYTIDYTDYAISFEDLQVIADSETECDGILLTAQYNFSDINYLDRNGNTKTLDREFTLEYQDSEWDGTSWAEKTINQTLSLPLTNIFVGAPKMNTTFKIWGDTWGTQMNVVPDTAQVYYTAVAIECHPEGTVVEREYTNESDRSSTSNIEGSAPLVVEFIPNVNPLDIIYYEWFISNTKKPNSYQRYNDTELRYTFEDTGEYRVKLVVSSANGCTFTDSLNITTISSILEAPNAFTPNGDGINDEWRVHYRSIDKYSCIIQNRWGRTVFTSNNPGKGWDGTIGGKKAAEGTYYYVIMAYGTDLDIKGKKMKYRLSGDINLFR